MNKHSCLKMLVMMYSYVDNIRFIAMGFMPEINYLVSCNKITLQYIVLQKGEKSNDIHEHNVI